MLVTCLGIISTWGARTFLTKGINVGLEGIVTVIRSGEATLGKFDNIVSETLPTAMIAVESMLAADREPSRGITVIQEKAVLLPSRRTVAGTRPTEEHGRNHIANYLIGK
jgi:hypothetical protein